MAAMLPVDGRIRQVRLMANALRPRDDIGSTSRLQPPIDSRSINNSPEPAMSFASYAAYPVIRDDARGGVYDPPRIAFFAMPSNAKIIAE